MHTRSAADPDEVRKFSALSRDWWDADGPFAPLHRLNPVRLTYIRDQICRALGRDPRSGEGLSGLDVLDIGSGGGLVSEPLARLGARVSGVDPSSETIRVAEAHAKAEGLGIRYEAGLAETLAARGESFDCVLALEVVEHVPSVPAFLETAARLLRPDGLMILSTINRTLKSFALAIVGAEYVLRWVPAGTHQWRKFVTPDELAAGLDAAGFATTDTTGMIYSPFADAWRLSSDTDVNYLATARPKASR